MFARSSVQALKNRVVRWNLFCNVTDGALATLGWQLATGSFVISPFLRDAGASDSTIGLIATIVPLATFLIPVLAAGYVQSLRRKKPYVTLLGAIQRTHFFVMAGLAMLLLPAHPTAFLALFVASSCVFVGSSQAVSPGWMDLVAKTTPPEKRATLFALRNSIGILPTFFAAGLVTWLLTTPSLPFPSNYATIFLISAISFGLSLIPITMIRERGGKTRPAQFNPLKIFRDIPRVLRRDGEFLRFILANCLLNIGGGMVGLFLMLTAADRFHISAGEISGKYMAVTAAVTVLGNILFVRVGNRFGHKFNIVLRSPLFALGCLIALFARNPWEFGVAFVPLTLAGSAGAVSQMAMSMDFGSERNRPRYYAIQSTVGQPIMALGPLLGGVLRDTAPLGVSFGIAMALAMAGGALQMTVRDPRGRGHARRAREARAAALAEGGLVAEITR